MHGTRGDGVPIQSAAAAAAAAARQRLAVAAGRSAELLSADPAPAPDLPLAGSRWSIADGAAHLIVGLRSFTAAVTGAAGDWDVWRDQVPQSSTSERIVALNRLTIGAEPSRSPRAAAGAVVAGADAFLAATAGLPPDQPVATPWYGEGASLTVHQATCLLLGEQIVHGYDMAKAAHRPWPISDHDALLTFAAARAMMPKLADPVAIGATTATFELRLGRAERFVVRVADRAVATEPVAGQPIDCHVLADPVAMLLLGYGRINLWRAIGRAKMITWGRRPWLAFRLPAFFSQP